MADVKFTGLTAGTTPIDENSVLAVSVDDGGGTFNSRKFTMNQFREIMNLYVPEDKITFDASGTNKIFVEETSGDFKFEIGDSGYKYWQLDITTGGASTGVFNNQFTDEVESGINVRDKTFSTTKFAGFAGRTQTYNASNSHALCGYIESFVQTAGDGFEIYAENNANNYTTPTQDRVPIIFSGSNITVNAGVTNSVAAGGVGYTVANDDTLYCDNFEHVGTDIGFFGATATTKPTVTGSRAGNAALADLLTELATLGLITDSTSA